VRSRSSYSIPNIPSDDGDLLPRLDAGKKPPKIAVLGVSHPFRGGISHHSTLLVRRLRTRYDVTFLTLRRQFPKFLFPGKTQYDLCSKSKLVEQNQSTIDSLNPLTWFRTASQIGKQGVDLVIIQWWHPFFALSFGTIAHLLSSNPNVKVCAVCHNVQPHERTFLDRLLTKFAFRRIDYFITHSQTDRNELLKIKPDAIVTSSCHPSYSVFGDFGIPGKQEARHSLGLDKDRPTLLFFGFVRPYKGLKVLLKAMRIVVRQLDCRLMIVGEFFERKSEYLRLVAELGLENHVHIVDEYIRNEDVSTYFCASDAVVLPYVTATQSGVIQIAFGLERPVITTDAGGLPEAVEHGQTGLIATRDSPESLAAAIETFYRERHEEAFTQEIRNTSARFAWDHEIGSIQKFLDKSREPVPG
jgi:glycosyltransferase involved in cell wall biosynthesis